MTSRPYATLLCWALTVFTSAALAQTDPNPAMNTPDQFAWQMFIQVNANAGGSNALFETWASDSDTFKITPAFPSTPVPLALHAPIVPTIGRLALQATGRLLPAIPPNVALTSEETRRNRTAFDFIVQNNLYKVSGLRAAYGKTISFPVDATEIKANWVAVTNIPSWTLNRVTVADAPKFFHVNTGGDGKQYALVGMHIITKQVPNWTWATFENEFNAERCDTIGCKDNFGTMAPVVAPNPEPGKGYPTCTKTPALSSLFAKANLDTAFSHYCLKGSQTDFTDNSGLDIRLGNSVAEAGFVPQSSCMTCHGRAVFNQNGQATTQAGFDNTTGNAPLGPIQPSWYWNSSAEPPIFEGMSGLSQIATSADFVWSIPFCAIDDTVTPPKPKRSCLGK